MTQWLATRDDATTPCLEALGVPRASAVLSPERFAELRRVARRLHASGKRRVGLLPVDEHTDAARTGVELGLSLAELMRRPIAAVTRCPRLSGLACSQPLEPDHARIHAAPHLTVILPTPSVPRRESGTWLARALPRLCDEHDFVLVDLSAPERDGELLFGLELVEHVVLLIRAGRTQRESLTFMRGLLGPGQSVDGLLLR